MNKTFSILALIAIAVASGFALREVFRIRDAQRQEALATAQGATLRDEVARLEIRRKTADEAIAELQEKMARLAAESDAAGASNALHGLSAKTLIALDAKKMANYLANFRASLDLRYGPLFHARGLSASQIAAFKELRVRSEQRTMDRHAAAEIAGRDLSAGTYRPLALDDSTQLTAAETQSLAEIENQAREFNRIQPVRDLVQRLASTEIATSEPLTASQVEAATRIIAENSAPNPKGATIHYTVNWEGAEPQLRAVMSPSTLATLRQFADQRDLMEQSQQQINRLMAPFK